MSRGKSRWKAAESRLEGRAQRDLRGLRSYAARQTMRVSQTVAPCARHEDLVSRTRVDGQNAKAPSSHPSTARQGARCGVAKSGTKKRAQSGASRSLVSTPESYRNPPIPPADPARRAGQATPSTRPREGARRRADRRFCEQIARAREWSMLVRVPAFARFENIEIAILCRNAQLRMRGTLGPPRAARSELHPQFHFVATSGDGRPVADPVGCRPRAVNPSRASSPGGEQRRRP